MHPFPVKQIYLKQEENVKIAFLDRDGTLNEEREFLTDEKQISIFENSFAAVKLLNDLKYTVLVITNQPVVARGLITVEKLKEINNTFFAKFKEKGAIINGIYSCIHHPNANVEELRAVCECRKPGTLMLREGLRDFDATLEGAFIVGDKTSDIKAGTELGIFSVLVKTGDGGKDGNFQVTPDLVLDDLLKLSLFFKNK